MTRYNKEYAQEYYKKNKEKIADRNRKWQESNREKMRQYQAKYKSPDNPTYVRRTREYFPKALWTSAKHNATKYGLEFDLEITDIVIPERCPYLDVPFTYIHGGGNIPTNPSVDKIDPTKGYVRGNIQIISRKANLMKNNASLEELKTFAKNILKLH